MDALLVILRSLVLFLCLQESVSLISSLSSSTDHSVKGLVWIGFEHPSKLCGHAAELPGILWLLSLYAIFLQCAVFDADAKKESFAALNSDM